ncbi:MAG: hypothetical protein U0529_01920 [Thermoanaerobaculia bacterium]
MKTVLLYSPDVIGHPRVYCRVIADALAGTGCRLVVAMGFTEEAGLEHSPDLQPLVGRNEVELVETCRYSRSGSPHLRAEEIVGLQKACGAETTLFIEADKSHDEFRRISAGGAPRLRGRNLGIFANTAEWYPGEDSQTGAPKRLRASTLRTTLGNVKRAVFGRRSTAKYFYERVIIGRNVLDEVLAKDERLVAWRGRPVYWMPEISRPARSPESSADAAEYLEAKENLAAFIARSEGREPVLYFGDAAYYKGYDLFLQLLATTPSLCGLHPGRPADEQQKGWFRIDVDALRARLVGEGRLLETGRYVHAQRIKELFFGAVRLYVTTHRLTLSSSTVIQALELGKPVLVPDRGLLGYRVRTNSLGDVYAYEDLDDLRRKAEKLWASDLRRFAEPARAFWARFSDEAIRGFFVERLLG